MLSDVFRSYRHGSYNFTVFIGPMKMGFSKISNLGEEREFEPLAEGGLNDRVHYLAKPRAKRETLIMERGVAAINPLAKKVQMGAEYAMGFHLGGRILAPILIMVQSDDRLTPLDKMKTYSVSEGIVTRWDVGEFDALNGQVLVERFEISHCGLTEVM